MVQKWAIYSIFTLLVATGIAVSVIVGSSVGYIAGCIIGTAFLMSCQQNNERWAERWLISQINAKPGDTGEGSARAEGAGD